MSAIKGAAAVMREENPVEVLGEAPQTIAEQYGEPDRVWERVCERFRREYGAHSFQTWIGPLSYAGREQGLVLLFAPTKFVRDWVLRQYASRLKDFFLSEAPETRDIEIRLKNLSGDLSLKADEEGNIADLKQAYGSHEASLNNQPSSRDNGADRASFANQTKRDTSRSAVQNTNPQSNSDEEEALLDPRYIFDNFVVGKSNELAYAAAKRIAESDDIPFNPLFLHGGVGLGKTHLMHAIAWEVRRRSPERRVVYVSAERFMYEFITAVRYKDTHAFKQRFRSVDLLMVDDVQFIANKESTQDEFFHTFNAVIDNRCQVVITADRSPTDLQGIEERIVSRLGWGLVADIHPTDYELRLGILQSKAERAAGLLVPEEVLEFLARRITSNVRELEGALNRVMAYATLVGRPLSMDMTRDVLQDLLRANDRKVTIEEIQRVVSDYYNIRPSDILSERRSRAVARPRQVAMFLAKQLTAKSLPEIGRRFGGRDHTTVMYGVRKVEDLRRSDSQLDEDLTRLIRQLEG